jgi:cysteine desulfurase
VPYLDHAATTPVRPQVAAAIAEQLGRVGNPSSVHAAGRAARRGVEDARERLAAALGVAPGEVVWTSGGTEADNLAVKGLWWARQAEAGGGPGRPARPVVAVSAVEHHAVLDPARWLASQGAEVVELPVDGVGRVRLDALEELLSARGDEVALVSVMWANNEVGTLQPVEEAVALSRARGVPVHTDAVQAVGHVPVDLGDVPVDTLALSAHKVGGPVGGGALVVRRGVALEAVLHGGGHEGGRRSGTLDAAAAVGTALAVEAAVAGRAAEAARVAALRDALFTGVRRLVPDAVLRGPEPSTGSRLPGNLHVTIPGCDADALLFLLDARGIEASAGSACTAGVLGTSHVLAACAVPEREARGALRLTLGWTSTAADVDAVLVALPEVVERARAAAAAVG